jgi:DNA-binding CsgD family transcriptional regulator
MASRGSYERRSKDAWQPKERQRQVLDLLVEGKTNAQIAQRLGISADGVKWHVSELLTETGFEDRRALALWWREGRGEERRPALALLQSWRIAYLAPLAAVIVLALVAALLLGDGSEDTGQEPSVAADIGQTDAAEALLETIEPPDDCAPPEQLDLRLVTPDELRAEGLVSNGRLFAASHCPIFTANRIDRALIWVGGNSVVDMDNPPSGWRFAGAADLGIGYEQGQGGPVLDVIAVGLHSKLKGAGVRVHEQERAVLTLRTQDEGSYLLLLQHDHGNPRRVAMASNGELFVEPAFPRDDAVVNYITGEEIDVSGLRQLSKLPGGQRPGEPQARTRCVGGPCSAEYSSVPAGVTAPFAGRLVCGQAQRAPAENEFDLVGAEFKLHFRTLDPNTIGPNRLPAEWKCDSREVATGEALPVSNIVFITAFCPDGSQLSIVTSLDGTLYVGDVKLRFPCPCGWSF